MPEDDFLICGASLASIPQGNLRKTIMQIHRCMPRPNNWTHASEYFKMPFCLLLIVFRPQCEGTRQEHVGVVWRTMGLICPNLLSKAIKNEILLAEWGGKHLVVQECPYDILCWYVYHTIFKSLFLIWPWRVYVYTIITVNALWVSQEINFTMPSANVTPEGLNELCLFCTGLYCMCVQEIRNV